MKVLLEHTVLPSPILSFFLSFFHSFCVFSHCQSSSVCPPFFLSLSISLSLSLSLSFSLTLPLSHTDTHTHTHLFFRFCCSFFSRGFSLMSFSQARFLFATSMRHIGGMHQHIHTFAYTHTRENTPTHRTNARPNQMIWSVAGNSKRERLFCPTRTSFSPHLGPIGF